MPVARFKEVVMKSLIKTWMAGIVLGLFPGIAAEAGLVKLALDEDDLSATLASAERVKGEVNAFLGIEAAHYPNVLKGMIDGKVAKFPRLRPPYYETLCRLAETRGYSDRFKIPLRHELAKQLAELDAEDKEDAAFMARLSLGRDAEDKVIGMIIEEAEPDGTLIRVGARQPDSVARALDLLKEARSAYVEAIQGIDMELLAKGLSGACDRARMFASVKDRHIAALKEIIKVLTIRNCASFEVCDPGKDPTQWEIK